VSRASCLVCVLLAALASDLYAAEADEEATEAFESLYGADMKRVAATAELADDLALAKKLAEAARKPTTHAALAVVLCEKAHDLSVRHPDGLRTATGALATAAKKAPKRAVELLQRCVDLWQKRYDASGRKDKSAGIMLVVWLENLGEAQVKAGDTKAAEATFRRGLALDTAYQKHLRAHLDTLLAHKLAEIKIKALAAALDKAPDSAKVRNELVRLCTVELDDPSRAATYLGDGVDAAFAKYVPAAARGTKEVPEAACKELGDWYRGLASTASTGAKDALLRRALDYYRRFLELHDREDEARAQGVRLLNQVHEALGTTVTDPFTSAASVPAGKPLATGKWIDILAMVDLKRDCTQQKHVTSWQRQGKTLVCHQPPRIGGTCIALPVAVDGSYEFQVKLIFRTVDGSFTLYLPVADKAVSLSMRNRFGTRLENIKDHHRNHDISYQANRVYTIDASVTVKDNDATVVVRLDGRPLERWQGPVADLYAQRGTLGKRIGLAPWRNATIFGLARLRMTSGKATAMRP